MQQHCSYLQKNLHFVMFPAPSTPSSSDKGMKKFLRNANHIIINKNTKEIITRIGNHE